MIILSKLDVGLMVGEYGGEICLFGK